MVGGYFLRKGEAAAASASAAEHGIETVRQRHQGTSFVNSAPKNSSPNENTKPSNMVPRSMKFVTQKNPEGKKRTRQAHRTRTRSHENDSHQRQAGLDGSLGSGQITAPRNHFETDPGTEVDETEATDFSWEMETGGPFVSSGWQRSSDLGTDLFDLEMSWDHGLHQMHHYPVESEGAFTADPRPQDRAPSQTNGAPTIGDAIQPASDLVRFIMAQHKNKLFNRYHNFLCPTLSWPLETLHLIAQCPGNDGLAGDQCHHDTTALDFTILIGALQNSLDTMGAQSDETTLYYSKLCTLVTGILSCEQVQPSETLVGVIHAVASLAMVATDIGNYVDWNVQLQRLKWLVSLLGGLARLPPSTRTLIRKADLKGSIELLSEPVFSFIRFTESTSGSIPTTERQDTRQAVIQGLLGTGIEPCLIENFVCLAHYIQAIDCALRSDEKIKYDTNALAEDWFSIQHSFLTLPTPMQHPEAVHISYSNGERKPLESRRCKSCGISRTESDELSLKAKITYSFKSTLATTPGDDSEGTLVRALRLTGLLCMMLHGPINAPRGQYNTSRLLLQLIRVMRVILSRIYAQPSNDTPGSNPGSSAPPDIVQARRALIWMCVTADCIIAKSYKEGWWRDEFTANYAVIGQLLTVVLTDTREGEALLSDGDLELCHVFDFMRLKRQEIDARNIVLSILNKGVLKPFKEKQALVQAEEYGDVGAVSQTLIDSGLAVNMFVAVVQRYWLLDNDFIRYLERRAGGAKAGER